MSIFAKATVPVETTVKQERKSLPVDAKSATIRIDHYGSATGLQAATTKAKNGNGTYTVTIDAVTDTDGVFVYATGTGTSYGQAIDDAIDAMGAITDTPQVIDGDATVTRHRKGNAAGTITVRYYDPIKSIGVKFYRVPVDAIPTNLTTVKVRTA